MVGASTQLFPYSIFSTFQQNLLNNIFNDKNQFCPDKFVPLLCKGCKVAKVTLIFLLNFGGKDSERLRVYESYGGCAGPDFSVIFKGILKVASLQRLQ